MKNSSGLEISAGIPPGKFSLKDTLEVMWGFSVEPLDAEGTQFLIDTTKPGRKYPGDPRPGYNNVQARNAKCLRCGADAPARRINDKSVCGDQSLIGIAQINNDG
ncbi:hypothetical protein STW0522PSE72_18210 [Pseudomonas monteilii]|nr:hypothetical protein STW0522PSE72_18210 [Pseudomonas monteilii]